jgi:threonine dehydrogenase-like Zn-dependent dehydrogenase
MKKCWRYFGYPEKRITVLSISTTLQIRSKGSVTLPVELRRKNGIYEGNIINLIDLIWNRKINPGKVFDLTLPLAQVAEGYKAMDERRAIKALLHPRGGQTHDCMDKQATGQQKATPG